MALLEAGLIHLSIEANPQPFMDYLFLLEKWNKSFNLTAVRELDKMVTRHILDSLCLLPWLSGSEILDVGSGAGLPGIPLALACPDKHFVLMDSNGKKTRFMQEAKRALGLDNIDIIKSRAEDFAPQIKFDTILSRAFSSLPKMLSLTQHLLAEKGIWLAMKGRYPQEELDAINHSYEVMRYKVFGLDEERCCVIVFS